MCETGRSDPSALSHPARDVLLSLEEHGASFFIDLTRQTGRLPSEVEDGLWELLAGGFVTADGFDNLRALVDPKRRRGEGRGHKKRPRHAGGKVGTGPSTISDRQLRGADRAFRTAIAREMGRFAT